MFENLSEKFDRAFKVIKGKGKINEINIAESLKEVRKALIDADVSYAIAKEFCATVKEKALGKNVLAAVEPGQMMIKIVKDELTELMGGETQGINLGGHPSVVLIAGLQGSGKTTFSAKLANYLKTKKNKSVLLVAGDVYRPAAINQLKVLAEQISTEVYTEDGSKDPVSIAKHAIAQAKDKGLDVVIIDTAGRLAIDEQMMLEIQNVKAATSPTETLFVVDSMTGQDAVNTAKAFNEKIDYDGVVLTKLDGDTRGGAALTVKHVVNKPIKFISLGEKIADLDVFHPDRMASRILGMGDIVSLVEKAQAEYDEQQARQLTKKIKTNEFDFDDFISQIAQIKKMGNIKDLVGMIPGMGKMMKDVDIDNDAFKSIEAMIGSMTPYERKNPSKIDTSRRRRIARGSGTTIDEVNRLMKQFEQTRKMMKMMSTGKLNAIKNIRKR